jgi:hypothetical protein
MPRYRPYQAANPRMLVPVYAAIHAGAARQQAVGAGQDRAAVRRTSLARALSSGGCG